MKYSNKFKAFVKCEYGSSLVMTKMNFAKNGKMIMA